MKQLKPGSQASRILAALVAGETLDQMFDIITKRKGRHSSPPDEFDYRSNYAEPGPNGLVRHTIGPYCLGHGEGTWDLIPGAFS